jgi:CubicO group peptidase (beta-lactamase class C family)
VPRRTTRLAAALIAILLTVLPASAQQNEPEYLRAIAAGYKASFICSNQFNGGINPARTAADDLQGTYAELNPILPMLAAEVDEANRRVTVPFAENLPPRVAAWRPHLGCALLPIGADPAAAAGLPRISDAPLDLAELDARPWPMGDREAGGRLRGDARALDQVADNAFDRRTYGQGSETTALLIVQHGRIVVERYRPDFDMHTSQRTWSVAKSIAGTVIGAAAQQGLIEVNAPAIVPEWQRPGDPRQRITTDHLLRMASGLHSDHPGNRTDALYFGGLSVGEEAASWPVVAPPDTRFRYANNDIVLAIRALQHRLGDGEEARAFPLRALFWKIGMTRTVPETDWQGHFVMSSQVWTTARDLARLGLLYANDGMWGGELILPAGWVDYVRRQGPAQPASGDRYGASWWLFAPDKGLPADAILANGNRGQYVVVIPSRHIVIVRRGFDRAGMGFDPGGLTRDILTALGDRR